MGETSCLYPAADRLFSLSFAGGAEVLHIFPFDYSLQRMSVIVRFQLPSQEEGSNASFCEGLGGAGAEEGEEANTSCVLCSSPTASLQRKDLSRGRKKTRTTQGTKSQMTLFCKGSYESIGPLCTRGLPVDFMDRCNELALQGFYVLALAYRTLHASSTSRGKDDVPDPTGKTAESEVDDHENDSVPPHAGSDEGLVSTDTLGKNSSQPNGRRTDIFDSTGHKRTPGSPLVRDSLENSLHFLCLVLFRNDIKPDAREAIDQLKQGRVRPVMVTGDSLLTAVSVAKACGMMTADTSSSSVLLNAPHVCTSADKADTPVAFVETTRELDRAQGKQALGREGKETTGVETLRRDLEHAEKRQFALPPLLIGEAKDPKDLSRGVIWRNADDRNDVYSEHEVYEQLRRFGGQVQKTHADVCCASTRPSIRHQDPACTI